MQMKVNKDKPETDIWKNETTKAEFWKNCAVLYMPKQDMYKRFIKNVFPDIIEKYMLSKG